MPATMLSAAPALLMLLIWTIRAEKRTYMTYDLPTICAQHSSFRIRMHHSGTGSTGLLKAKGLLSAKEERECVALIRPPRGYGVVISLRAPLRLRRDEDGCRDYVKIHNETTLSNASTPLCGECCDYAPATCEPGCGYGAAPPHACSAFCGGGYPDDLSGDGALVVHYHTRCGACADEDLGFQMVFTAYRVVPAQEAPCVWPSDFECANGRCIWSGLTCDGHDNCGDNSDENKAGNAHCAGEFPDPVKAAVVASAVIVTVLLGVLLAYFPKMKLRSWLGFPAAHASCKKPEAAKRPERRSVSFQSPLPKIRENSLSESEV